MNDRDLVRIVDDYLAQNIAPKQKMLGVAIVWERDDPGFGAKHIASHGVTETEVEQVLLEIPPYVEAKQHPGLPNRTLFWGATRWDRWLFIVCQDWTENGIRYLLPITAFNPEEGVKYWERFK